MRTVQFVVGRLEYIGSGKFLVAGRNCGDELRKGDRLQVLGGCSPDSIEVIVDEIKMNDRVVTSVGSGSIAGLFLKNELAHHFRLGSELHGEII